MKKILLLFTLFLLFGCQNILKKTNENVSISCPQVFFSSENNVYIQGDLDSLNLEKIIREINMCSRSDVRTCSNLKVIEAGLITLIIVGELIAEMSLNVKSSYRGKN